MKKIIVTAAGREPYLSILAKYINYAKENNEFDEWHLWCNTKNESDINYIYELGKKYAYIKVIPLSDDYEWLPGGSHVKKTEKGFWFEGNIPVYACTVSYFYRFCTENDSVYLKLDDDIVFIKKESIKNIFNYRIDDVNSFLVFGNTINNCAINYLHQKTGALSNDLGYVTFDGHDSLGLYNSKFVEFIHNTFFEHFKNNTIDKYYFEPYLVENTKVLIAIQAITWRGDDFKKFEGKIHLGCNDEEYLAVTKPNELMKTNIIYGNCLFNHYSSTTTRTYISQTNILNKYEEVAEQYLK